MHGGDTVCGDVMCGEVWICRGMCVHVCVCGVLGICVYGYGVTGTDVGVYWCVSLWGMCVAVGECVCVHMCECRCDVLGMNMYVRMGVGMSVYLGCVLCVGG